MTTGLPGKRQHTATCILRVILALTFVVIGVTKLTGTANTVAYFTAIGWGQWFRYATGLLDLAGSALLFVPQKTCYGALALTISVGLATLLSLTVLRGNPAWGGLPTVLVPLVFTVLAATLAWMTRPRRPLRT